MGGFHPLQKTMLQLSWDNKLGIRLYLPNNYPCAKFGCHNSISDVIMTPSIFFRQRYQRCCKSRFISLRKRCYYLYLIFGMPECCSLQLNRKIAKSSKKLSNYGLQKPLKSSKFWIFSEMLTSAKFFVKCQCFRKR